MKVRLKALLDKPRGGAWPPSARAVRCPIKFDNERDPCQQLLAFFLEGVHIVETALETRRKVWATVGLYAPNLLGNTRATMIRTMGCDSERRS